jgi:hypothetical protein
MSNVIPVTHPSRSGRDPRTSWAEWSARFGNKEGLNVNTPEKAEIRELAVSELDQVNGGALPLVFWAAVGFCAGFTGATIGYEAASAYIRLR